MRIIAGPGGPQKKNVNIRIFVGPGRPQKNIRI